LDGLIDAALTPTPEFPGAPTFPTEPPPPTFDIGPADVYTDYPRIDPQQAPGVLDRLEPAPSPNEVETMVIQPRLETIPLDAVTVPEYSPQDPDDIYR
jgi:hypothetical protein